jgi:hypothetical protein
MYLVSFAKLWSAWMTLIRSHGKSQPLWVNLDLAGPNLTLINVPHASPELT